MSVCRVRLGDVYRVDLGSSAKTSLWPWSWPTTRFFVEAGGATAVTLGIDEGLLGSLSRIDLTTGATTNLAEATVFAPHTIVPEAGGATALYLENSPLDGAILRITIPPASP